MEIATDLDAGDENAGTAWYEGWVLAVGAFVAAALAVWLLGRRSKGAGEPG